MKDIKAIEFRAELRQIKTMADRTINVTLNLPEDCREQAKILMDWLGLEIGGAFVKDYKMIDSNEKAKVK